MSEYLKDAFSKPNLRRAWKWTLSNTEYAYKNYFRDLYQAYSIAIDDNIDVKKVKQRYNNTVFGHLYAGKSSNFFYQKWDNSYKQFNKSIKSSYKQGSVVA